MKKQTERRKPSRISPLIAELKRKEDAARAERRRRLAKGFNRALKHLRDDEMADLLEIVYRAIGRSVVQHTE